MYNNYVKVNSPYYTERTFEYKQDNRKATDRTIYANILLHFLSRLFVYKSVCFDEGPSYAFIRFVLPQGRTM